MTETIQLILMLGSALLFRLGGMGVKPFRKGWRRYMLPLFLFIIGLITTYPNIPKYLWLSCIITLISFHLPYGERTPYIVKFLVACSFVAGTLFMGFTIWQIITPIIFIILFKLSNWKPLSNEFGWGLVEVFTGLMIGITYGQVYMIGR